MCVLLLWAHSFACRCLQDTNKHTFNIKQTLWTECTLITKRKKETHTHKVCFVLFVGCLSSQQHASVSQGRICSDNFTCCHIEIEAAGQTFHLTQSQYTDTGPTSPSADPIMPGAWQGSHWSANFSVTGMTRPRKIPALAGFEPGTSRSRGGRTHTRNNFVLIFACGNTISTVDMDEDSFKTTNVTPSLTTWWRWD